MSKRIPAVFSTVAIVLTVVVTVASAQQPGRGGPGGRGGFGFGGFGGGGSSLLGLLRIEEVQKEIEMLEDQVADVRKLQEELRPAGAGGDAPRRRGGGGADGGNRPQLTEEQIAEFRKQREEQVKVAQEKLEQILLPHQIDRLKEIDLQVQGVRALSDPKVQTSLKISADQKQKMEEVNQKSQEEIRTQMRELFGGGGDRSQLGEKMAEFRKKAESQVLAVLTDQQKAEFEKMKGKPFQMPEGAFGGFGGRGGRGGRGGDGGGRPARPN